MALSTVVMVGEANKLLPDIAAKARALVVGAGCQPGLLQLMLLYCCFTTALLVL
jgi:hypothetical protein